jgi:hypothetical protein
MGRRLTVLLFAALAACAQESGQLSLEEARGCAAEAFRIHPGTFSLADDSIAYSYESANGSARVVVVFDAGRRPVRTFFESAPYGSHQELMDAARVIKDCVAYGPKAREESDKGAARA